MKSHNMHCIAFTTYNSMLTEQTIMIQSGLNFKQTALIVPILSAAL